jgi:hypothetical protein
VTVSDNHCQLGTISAASGRTRASRRRGAWQHAQELPTPRAKRHAHQYLHPRPSVSTDFGDPYCVDAFR